MYGNASSPFASRTQRASMYRKVGLETDVQSASPHRLVSMLFDGIFDAMNQALVAIASNNTAQKNNSLCRAVRILDEGLKSTLNLEAGPLAQDLGDLYAYLCMRLTQANLHGDSARIEECQRLLTPVRDAWNAIAQSPEVQRAA
ncbi:flagellar export chaperone FliS [Paucibacter sp. DJ1R-11]|uniref:flagellar export chaperone FliS n=2 Tax=unclassified Roseateles TaxID=2626991 RepID=UPI0021E41EF0|nr:flagellar export chaperone FliS [Paucibacter sp. DJ1R-11]MCV2366247.1 flagellar export chaperone FliS [Paucibacter sp. DJ1R-11]MCV2441487.1 flagellar export chaperone FliS [Paucibacter sp. DJ2R-2]